MRHFLKCFPNLSLREQPLLPVLGCVQRRIGRKCLTQDATAEMLLKTTQDPSILQLNTERLITNKITVIEQLAFKNKDFIVVLQETHCTTADKLVIPNFPLVGSVLSRNHGIATFVHERLEWSLVDQSPEQSETEWLCVDVAGHKIVNVYKPPRSQLSPTVITRFPNPSLFVGGFNCQHVNWGYNKTSPDGESLDSWATANNLELLYNPKG